MQSNIPSVELTDKYSSSTFNIDDNTIEDFQRDGYAIFKEVFTQDTIDALNHRLELVLRGEYDTGMKPDKTPKLIKTPIISGENVDKTEIDKKALGYSGNPRKKVFQIINIHKSDQLFRSLVTCPLLGELVARVMKWEDGARLAQDQIWAKPPGSPPLAYHRDSPYFMFTPNDVATVWIAFDDMAPELGPLEYVKGSHRWGDGRWGSSQNFFQGDGGKALLYSAAERAGIDAQSLEYHSMAGLKAGGLSIHDGRTWHGSGQNKSSFPRRGIGLHFVPVHVRWTVDAKKSILWRKYVEEVIDTGGEVSEIEVDGQVFPVTWINPFKKEI